MLIRSQDKETLVEITGMSLRIFHAGKDPYELAVYGNNQAEKAEDTLGYYATKERALEIEDEILTAYGNACRTYQMPEE